MISRVQAAGAAAVFAMGLASIVLAQTTTKPAPLPKFGTDLCGSYVEHSAVQRAKALKPELRSVFSPLKGRAQDEAVKCGVRVVEDLRAEVVDACFADQFSAEDQGAWEARVDQGLLICVPGPIPAPAPEPTPEPAPEPS